jgi:hypothetical protein
LLIKTHYGKPSANKFDCGQMLISISEIIQINCIEIYIKNPKFTVDHSFDFELYLYSALISQMKSYEIYFVVYGN